MSEEQPTTPSRLVRPKFTDAFRVAIAEQREGVSHARPVMGTARQVYTGALLGTCVVCLVSLVAVPQLDTALQVALLAFIASIALLIMAFALYSFGFPSRLSERDALTAKSIDFGVSYVCEFGGTLTAIIGITAYVGHLNGWRAVLVGWGTLIFGFLAFTALAAVYQLRHPVILGSPPADEMPQQ